ncbi:MAG TPA: universal stress protein [bacterium]|nr:universal stress protein [bacterium]
MFRKIAVLFDFSWTSRQALEWAVHLASRFGSSLGVIHALSRREDGPETESRIQAEIDLKIRRLGEGRPPASVSVHIHSGRTVDTLIASIEADAPDLVVLGTHGQTGLLHVLLGSVAEKIVRHSPSPTLVVKRGGAWPPRSLLIPVSFEDAAYEESLLAASELRGTLGVSVELLHVTEPPQAISYVPEAVIALPPFDPDAAVMTALAKLREITSRHASLSLVPHAVVGQAAHEICLAAARTGSDMILMPTHGLTGAARWLLGSVTEQVIRHAPCSVLSFRPGRLAKG